MKTIFAASLLVYTAVVPCATAVWLPWPLSALQTHLSGAAASPARHESVVGPPPPREVPLPYALQDKPHPRGYVALQARQPPAIDGQLDEPVWDAAAWSEQFLDIVGPTGPQALLGGAAVKMVWDEHALYVAARLEDAALFANQTLHDSIVYHDANFEIFIDPDANNHLYFEIEINALGTVWDLLLMRPYRNGAPAIMSFEAIPPAVPTIEQGPTGWEPMRHAVWVDGEVNSQAGTRAWQVEVSLPWSLLKQAAGGRRVPPRGGDAWRINFSRVMWTVEWDVALGSYVKVPADQEPYNFVWSPQYQVAMHQPETWGYVQFEELDVVTTEAPPFEKDPTWPARAYLMEVHNAQHDYWKKHRSFARALMDLPVGAPRQESIVQNVVMQATEVSFFVAASIPAPNATTAGCDAKRPYGGGWAATDRPARLMVAAEGRLDMFFPGGDEAFAYNPAQGGSYFC